MFVVITKLYRNRVNLLYELNGTNETLDPTLPIFAEDSGVNPNTVSRSETQASTCKPINSIIYPINPLTPILTLLVLICSSRGLRI